MTWKRGKTKKYVWTEWAKTCFDDERGQKTVLTRRYYDFDCKATTFRAMAYKAAKNMGCRVFVQLADDVVVLKFYR